MTLPTGTISMSQVNTELGLAATTAISLNQANVRTLAGVPSGTISMSNLQGKTNITPQFNNGNTWDYGTTYTSGDFSKLPSITFQSGGTITYSGGQGNSVSPSPTAYCTPTGAGIGSNIEFSVYFTNTSPSQYRMIWLGEFYFGSGYSTPYVSVGTARTFSYQRYASGGPGYGYLNITVTVRRTDGSGAVSRAGYIYLFAA